MSIYAIFEDITKGAFSRIPKFYISSDQLNCELNKGIKITPQAGLGSGEAGLIINADTADFAMDITGRAKLNNLAGNGINYPVHNDDGEIFYKNTCQFKIKSADQTISLVSFADDAHLAFTADANEKWLIESQIFLKNNDSDYKDARYKFTIPSGIIKGGASWHYNVGFGTNVKPDHDVAGTQNINLDTERRFQQIDYGTNYYAVVNIRGLFQNSSSAGTVHLQWAKDPLASTGFTVKQDSWLKASLIL